MAARAVTNAASVALALPADSPELVRAVTEGYPLGGYRFTTYKKPTDDAAPGTVTVLSPAARKNASTDAFETAQVVASAVATTRDWVNTPPGDFRPPAFADAVVEAAGAAGRAGAGPRSRRSCTTRSSSPSSAAAASSASVPGSAPRRGWSS